MAFRLAGVPEVVAILTFQDDRAVDVLLPAGLLSGAEDNLGRLAPMEAIPAFDYGQALLRPPREPHPIPVALL